VCGIVVIVGGTTIVCTQGSLRWMLNLLGTEPGVGGRGRGVGVGGVFKVLSWMLETGPHPNHRQDTSCCTCQLHWSDEHTAFQSSIEGGRIYDSMSASRRTDLPHPPNSHMTNHTACVGLHWNIPT
jgi:hypothetical protein